MGRDPMSCLGAISGILGYVTVDFGRIFRGGSENPWLPEFFLFRAMRRLSGRHIRSMSRIAFAGTSRCFRLLREKQSMGCSTTDFSHSMREIGSWIAGLICIL